MLTVTEITKGNLGLLEAHFPALMAGSTFSCSAVERYPSLRWLQAALRHPDRAYDVAIQTDDETFVALVVVRVSNAQIVWEVLNSNYCTTTELTQEAIYGFTQWTLARYGTSWGIVENPELRETMAACHPRLGVEADGKTITFDVEP